MNKRENQEVTKVATDVRSELCTNGRSSNMCHIVSKEIVTRLVALGYDATLVHCNVDTRIYKERQLSISHYYVQVNNKYLDATLDQFSTDRGHYIPEVVFGKRPRYVKVNEKYYV